MTAPQSSHASDAAPDEVSRFDLKSWVVLLCAIAYLAFIVVQASLRLGLPTDGWRLRPEAAGWTPPLTFVFDQQVLPGPTPLRAGDRLLAVDGRPVDAIFAETVGFRAVLPEDWIPGNAIRYEIERDGQPLELAIRLVGRSGEQIAIGLGRALVGAPAVILFFAIGLFVQLRRPRLTAAHLLFVLGTLFLGNLLSEAVGDVAPTVAELLHWPAFWVAQGFNSLAWGIAVYPALAHLFLSFPAPKGFMRRHRRLVLGMLYGLPASLSLLLGLFLLPTDPLAAWTSIVGVGLVSTAGIVPLALGALIHSSLTSRDPVVRGQIRWIAWGFVVLFGYAVGVTLLWLVGLVDLTDTLGATRVALLVLPASLAVAILRYRLFDIDVVLNRTLVAINLTACVVAVYVLTVSIVGALLQERASFAVSLLATGLVAVMVQPARDRLQRAVNRLMYGERDDPYRVVSRLGQRLEATVSPGAVLTIVAETVAQALKLPYAAVELTHQDRVIAAAAVGIPRGNLERLPLIYQGETLGALVLAPRSPGEAFGRADRRLLEVLARQTGVTANAARLTDDLRRSRARLVAAREEERRRLRRDLHDGLGPILAAVTLKLDAAANLLDRDPAAAESLVGELIGEVRRIREDIRHLVDGLRPPALDELGLAVAIRTAAQSVAGSADATGPVVAVEAPVSLPDLPAAVEVAAYRIALEAVTNVTRHAAARTCRVRLELARDTLPALLLMVDDDGRGLPVDYRAGVGLVSMRERATELGGRCIIESRPSGGTRVQAWLPLPAA